MKALGAEVELAENGMQEVDEGEKIPLPPILLGKLGNDPNKKTVCMYGHLDVQPAHKVGHLLRIVSLGQYWNSFSRVI